MTRYRTALIGAGFISATHIEAVKTAVPEAELVAIVDRNLALAKSRAAQWGIPNVYGDIEELIAAGVADVIAADNVGVLASNADSAEVFAGAVGVSTGAAGGAGSMVTNSINGSTSAGTESGE